MKTPDDGGQIRGYTSGNYDGRPLVQNSKFQNVTEKKSPDERGQVGATRQV